MLRALLARLNLTRPSADAAAQLELALGADGGHSHHRQAGTPDEATRHPFPEAEPRRSNPPLLDVPPGSTELAGNGAGRGSPPVEADRPKGRVPGAAGLPAATPRVRGTAYPPRASKPAPLVEDALLGRLRAVGLQPSVRLTLTRNRTVMVSFRGGTLRLHEGFAEAPDDVLRAVVVFMQGRGVARREAKRALLAHGIPREDRAPPRRERMHPDDAPLADRLATEHARLNAERFSGMLRPVTLRVSRRMKSRLGHYAPADSALGAEIVVSRRHIRRHGWPEAIETLLHEMVHQWQDESRHPIDHGARFREKAREVGVLPRARRTVD